MPFWSMFKRQKAETSSSKTERVSSQSDTCRIVGPSDMSDGTENVFDDSALAVEERDVASISGISIPNSLGLAELHVKQMEKNPSTVSLCTEDDVHPSSPNESYHKQPDHQVNVYQKTVGNAYTDRSHLTLDNVSGKFRDPSIASLCSADNVSPISTLSNIYELHVDRIEKNPSTASICSEDNIRPYSTAYPEQKLIDVPEHPPKARPVNEPSPLSRVE